MKNWDTLIGDVNWEVYGGSWGKQDPSNLSRFWILDFTNMLDACGESMPDGKNNICDVRLVDLSEIPAEDIRSALECCGFDSQESIEEQFNHNPDKFSMFLAECCSQYGTYAPMGSESSRYPMRARARARRLAIELMGDESQTDDCLNRPANAIGSSARDFMRGDILAGLRESADKVLEGEEVSPMARIMLKMYGASNGQTLGGKVEKDLAIAGKMV